MANKLLTRSFLKKFLEFHSFSKIDASGNAFVESDNFAESYQTKIKLGAEKLPDFEDE